MLKVAEPSGVETDAVKLELPLEGNFCETAVESVEKVLELGGIEVNDIEAAVVTTADVEGVTLAEVEGGKLDNREDECRLEDIEAGISLTAFD